jgi:cation transport ATPase
MSIETPNWGRCVNNQARLLLAWVLAGLAAGIALQVAGYPAYATIAWAAASLPVALHVAIGVLRSLLGGRLGVDVIALFSILGALALDEAAAAAVIALMVAGGEALEAWAEGRATGALTELRPARRGAHQQWRNQRNHAGCYCAGRSAAGPPRRNRARRWHA